MWATGLKSNQINRYLLAAVIFSLLATFLHMGPLYGSGAALVLAVIFQLYLPGYLLARALGRHNSGHPISRFAWILVGGLGLTVTLGGLSHLLLVPVSAYLLILHGVMLALALLPAGEVKEQKRWQFSRRYLPLYLMVIAACIVTVGVTLESRHRFWGFEDHPIFISHADWLAHNPGVFPHDLPLRSRQVGVIRGDTRFDTDGWTYNHAAWVWTTGVPAAQLIWFDLDLLFTWTIPLIFFALAYELTRREEAGGWSAAALMLVGLLTRDNIVYYPGIVAYGRVALFSLNTLRQMSIGVMMPLAFLVSFAYLHDGRRRDLIAVFLAGTALAMMHPIQVMLYLLGMGATLALRWLASPDRRTTRTVLPLLVVMLGIFTLPLVQRLNRSGLSAVDTLADTATASGGQTAAATLAGPQAAPIFTAIHDLPLLGTTVIRSPESVFYHPVILLAALLGLLYGFKWRKSLAAQYFFATTAAVLLLFFLPGLAEFYSKAVSTVGTVLTIFALPVALILGVSLDQVLTWTAGRLTAVRRYGLWATAGIVAVTIILLLFEPLPIPASTRDQIRAFNALQSLRYLHPAHMQLADSLKTLLPDDETSVLMTPHTVANIAIEELPRTLITGGRESRNTAAAGDRRFFTESDPPAPWLDTEDLAFMAQFGVTHIIMEADDTRLPQLLLQPERFELLDTPAGFLVFRLLPGATRPGPFDERFARMNALYGEMAQRRWGRDGFALVVPGDAETWEPLAAEWADALEAQPDDDLARLGLAFSHLMMGADEQALPLWQALHERYPDVALFTDALAHTQRVLGLPGDGVQTLLAAAQEAAPAARVLAARTLLTESFFYLLDDARLQQVLAVTEAYPIIWDQLANLDQPQAVRERVALLLSAGDWETALDWLAGLPEPELAPYDYQLQALGALGQGDIDGALDILRATTDPDFIAPNVFLHPDRWQENTAARSYELLRGAVAAHEGRWRDAEAAYRRAIDRGATWAGRYFLAQTLIAAGREEDGQALLADVEADWMAGHDEPFPELVSLLAVADHGALYVMDADVTQEDEAHRLTVRATYGTHRWPYPVQTWHVQVTSPDAAQTYAELGRPAVFVEGALTRAPLTLALPDDLPELTPARVFITPLYNEAITYLTIYRDVVLNRPGPAQPGPEAEAVGLHFGPDILLDSYEVEVSNEALRLTLYWQAQAVPAENYQIFVHVVDEDGQIVQQDDSGPVEGHYPTGQWRTETLIADPHVIPFESPLPEGAYAVRVGMYRLSDGVRLPVTPADDRVADNSVTLYAFTR